MSLDNLNTALVTHDLVQDLKWNAELRREFEQNRATVLDRYDLTPAERSAIERRDWRALYALGLHPYLGAQFARIVYSDRKEGGISAVEALLVSIRGESGPAPAGGDGTNAE